MFTAAPYLALPPPPPPPAGGTLVALDACSFAYEPDGPAALSVTLAIQSGMRVLVDGVTGAGKSLLLRALAGRLRPCTGTRSTGRFVQLLYWEDSLRSSDLEDVETPLEFVVRLGGGDDAACAEVLSSIGIDHFAARRPCSSLSSGERTLLTIAALAVAPKHLLLLDEPAAFLGRAAIDMLAEALAPERWPGALVFASSSPHLREALRPTHVAIVHGGRVELHALRLHGSWPSHRAGETDETRCPERECPRLHHHLPAGGSGGMARVMAGAPPLGATGGDGATGGATGGDGAAPAVGGTREPPLGGGGGDDDDMLWDADELPTKPTKPSSDELPTNPTKPSADELPTARAVPSASSEGMGSCGLSWLSGTDSMAATMAMSMAMMREMGMAQDEAFSAMQAGAAALRSVLAADRAVSGRPRDAQEDEDDDESDETDESGMRLEASPAPAARADGSHSGGHSGGHDASHAGVDMMGVEGHEQQHVKTCKRSM
jgi:ABC-type transport system involved in cytochrome c biogenesis ATPase subunit